MAFRLAEGEAMKLKEITEKFEVSCMPKNNEMFERQKFFMYMQKAGQTMDQYVIELRRLSKNCGLGDLRESLIRERIKCGL